MKTRSSFSKETKNPFILELRPILLMLKILGCLPLRVVPGSNSVEYGLVTWRTLYAILAFSAQIVPTIWLFYRGLLNTFEKEEESKIMSYAYLVFLVVPPILPGLLLLQIREQAAYVIEWGMLQETFEKTAVTRKPFTFGINRSSLITVWSLIILSFVLLFLRTVLFGEIMRIDETLRIFSFNYIVLLVSMWHSTSLCMIKASSRVLQEYKLLEEYNESGKFSAVLEPLVLKFRGLWLQLANLVRKSGDSVALAHCVIMVHNFACVLFFAYQLSVMKLSLLSLIFLSSATLSMTGIVLVCRSAHKVQERIYLDLIDAVSITKKLRITESTRHDMMDFLLHVAERSPHISFSGYIHVGRSLVTKLFSALVTNLTVLLQLHINQKSIDIEEFLNLADTFN